jgi:hypothetical protein
MARLEDEYHYSFSVKAVEAETEYQRIYDLYGGQHDTDLQNTILTP